MSESVDAVDTVDVVVVGAGYAGLTTALALVDAGLEVLVVEADERVGGRVWSRPEGEVVVDHGGQWVGPTQTALLELADRFGCARFRSYDEGRHVELWPGLDPVPYTSAEPPVGPGADDYHHLLDRLDALADEVPLERPTDCAHLEEWDGQTFESWLRAATDDEAVHDRLRLVIRGVWACEPRDVSLFHVLFYVRAAGGLTQLLETHDAAQDSRFVDGAQAPALAVAAALGDRVRLGHQVLEVRWDDAGAEVRTARGTIRCRRVVVTGTPAAQARIGFDPPLPPARRRWLARSPMGDVAKVHLVYATPFWRGRGLSGQVVAYDGSAISYTFDNSPAAGPQGVIAAFVYGDAYRAWSLLDREARQRAVTDSLVPVLGPEAADALHYAETQWPQHRWAEGAYAAVPTPGTWTEHGDTGWRTPAGCLHWAGTETADQWHGYIDGAVRSGRRAAREVVAALADPSHPDPDRPAARDEGADHDR